MAPLTAAELLDWLGTNLYLPGPQVEELRPLLPTWPDSHALAKELIQRAWMSPYQVNQILQGNGESLIVGPNRLLDRIGEGAMGQVFKAWNTRLGRHVAVKMLHKEHIENNRAMERFQREVMTAGNLDHPNIVLVRDADKAHDRPYMVMEYVEGEDLSQRVKQFGPLPLAEAVGYAHQAALGLQHAYERGVVHRDIKPSNLLLTSAGGAGLIVKISDFGLARFDSESRAHRLTHAGSLLGTVDYVAPEQAQDAHAADIRADIYSLGCTLFYLLTGRPPFEGTSIVEKIAARMHGDPPSVRAARYEVPAGLDNVVQRMMARVPEHRYQTPQEAANAMAPFMKLVPGETSTATLSQQELTAALAARKSALAIPLTQPVPAGVPVFSTLPMASPTAEALVPVVHALPVAIPLPAVPDAGTGYPFADAESAPGGPPATAAPPAPRGSRSIVLLAIGAGAALAVVVTAVIVIVNLVGPRSTGRYGPSAALRIMPLEPMTLDEGRKTPVIVTIQRQDFSGPVKIGFEKLPDGLQSAEITIKDGKNTDQLYLMASFSSGLKKADLRLVAVAQNLRDVAVLVVTIVSSRNEAVVD